jgi:hypothetical protein
MGSHNSDTETELVNIRQNLLRILERYKVDLIICGHSHCYERSKLMKGHYGNESTFNAATHHLSSSSAKYDGSTNSCPYIKNSPASDFGTVYLVTGSAGQLGGTQASWPHAAMYYSDAMNGGSLSIEIDQNRLDGKWVCADGVTRDQFSILKNVNKTTNVSVVQGQSTTLTASWVGNYSWSTGATTRSITITPSSSSTYTVTDGSTNCVTDIFNVTVVAPKAGVNSTDNVEGIVSMNAFPNPFENHTTVNYTVPFDSEVSLSLYNISGTWSKILLEENKAKGSYSYQLNSKQLSIPSGTYVLKLRVGDSEISETLSIIE